MSSQELGLAPEISSPEKEFGTAREWAKREGGLNRSLRLMDLIKGSPRNVEICPNGRFVYTEYDRIALPHFPARAILHDIYSSSGKKYYPIGVVASGGVNFSSDGRYIVTWPEIGKGHASIISLPSPDDDYLASISTLGIDINNQEIIPVYDITINEKSKTNEEVDASIVKARGIRNAIFSPDSNFLVVGYEDASVRIFDLNTNLEIGKFEGNEISKESNVEGHGEITKRFDFPGESKYHKIVFVNKIPVAIKGAHLDDRKPLYDREQLSGLVGNPRVVKVIGDGKILQAQYENPADEPEHQYVTKFFDLDEQKEIYLPIPYNASFIQSNNNIVITQSSHNGRVSMLDISDVVSDPKLKDLLNVWKESSHEFLSLLKRESANSAFTAQELLNFYANPTPERYLEFKDKLGVQEIHLSDSGNTTLRVTYLAEAAMLVSPNLSIEELPITFPDVTSFDIEYKKDEIEEVLSNYSYDETYGRTVLYQSKDINNPQKYLAIKYLRDNELPESLYRESLFFSFMNDLKALGVDLRGDYPNPHLIDNKRVLYTSVVEHLEEVNGSRPKKDSIDNYTVMMYSLDTPDYFTYAHEAEDEQAILNGVHDLFTLAKFGVIHPDIIELFHNTIQTGRPDHGRYLWMVDIIRPMVTRYGAGRINAWEKAVEYPNLGVTGIRDFAEMISLNDESVVDCLNPHTSSMYDLTRFSPDTRQKLLLSQYMGDYLLSAVLIEGKRMLDQRTLHWRGQKYYKHFGTWLKELYRTAYTAFTGKDDKEASDIVDWNRFAKQVAYYMGDGYKKWDLHEELFPGGKDLMYGERISGTPYKHGDGWGYVHKNIMEKEFDPEAIERYFTKAVSTRGRNIPDDVYVVNHDAMRGMDTSSHTQQELWRKLREHMNGWRYNGIDEDLGPVNGPMPIQELILANYVYTSHMLHAK